MYVLRSLIVIHLVACGAGSRRGSDVPPDASIEVATDAGAADAASRPDAAADIDAAVACNAGETACGSSCVDTASSNEHCGQCGKACDANETCSAGACKPGQPAAATGTCTYVDQPGWLSCPTGMSCRCYYHYYKLFENQPAELDVWIADDSLEVLGGTIPNNQTYSTISPTTIPLTGSPKTGATYPYTVAVNGTTTIELRATSGYVPAKYVLYSSSDCGNRGKVLECTFTAP